MTILPSTRIAVVEDDPDLLQTTLEFLHTVGFTAWGVSSGEAMYKRMLTEPVNLVILDVNLPGEDGFTIAKHLREISHLEVIIVSARDSLDDRITGLKAGADRYLVKPVNLSELVANIETVLTRQGLVDPTPIKPPAVWHLTSQNWTLISPEGCAIPLTNREYRLLQILIAAEGQTVGKNVIADKIIGTRFLNRNERLDVLLARLRKKAAATLKEPLPIKTAYQQGYVFTATAISD